MQVIDAHVHLYPPEVGADPTAWAAGRGESHWALLCTRRRKNGQAVQDFPSVDQLLRDMDDAGVSQAVLLGWYWENHATCVEQNRFYARCIAAHPDRLKAFATVHPAAGDEALAEVRWAADSGFRGLGELSPHSQHVSMSDESLRAVLQLAGELRMPVNFHVTDPESRPFPGRVDTPLNDFVAIAEECAQTTFILAHWGGGLAWQNTVATLPNVWFDTAASPLLYARDVWTKSPADRVLFGSDYPLILYPTREASASFKTVVAEASDAGAPSVVFAENATKLLRL